MTSKTPSSSVAQFTVKQAAEALAIRAVAIRSRTVKSADMAATGQNLFSSAKDMFTQGLNRFKGGPAGGQLNNAIGGAKKWWGGLDPAARTGIEGAGIGTIGGGLLGAQKDEDGQRHIGSGALTGAIGGGALGAGYGLMQHVKQIDQPATIRDATGKPYETGSGQPVTETSEAERKAILDKDTVIGRAKTLGSNAMSTTNSLLNGSGSASTTAKAVGGTAMFAPAMNQLDNWMRNIKDTSAINDPGILQRGLQELGAQKLNLTPQQFDFLVNMDPKKLSQLWSNARYSEVRRFNPNSISNAMGSFVDTVPAAGAAARLKDYGKDSGAFFRRKFWPGIGNAVDTVEPQTSLFGKAMAGEGTAGGLAGIGLPLLGAGLGWAMNNTGASPAERARAEALAPRTPPSQVIGH